MNNAQYNKNQKAENTDLSDFSGMSGSVAKAKDTKKTIKMLLTYSKKYLPGIIIAVIAAVAGTIIALVGPGKLKVLTNLITEGIPTIIDMPGIVKIGILLIVLYLTSALLNTLQGWIMATVTQKISQKMRIDISRKINRLPMWFYHKNTTGDILSRITNDVDSLGQNLNNSLTTLVTSITMLTGSLIMMFITNWTMTLAAIASVVLGFITMMIIMSKSQKHFDNQQKYLGLINGHIEETYTGHLIVKAYNGEQQMFEPFKGLNKKLNKSTYMAQFLSGLMMPIMTFVDNISYVAVIVVGASLVISGQISFGVIVAFLVYVRYFTQPLTQIAQLAQGLQMAVASGERVFEFLDAEEMADEKNKKAPLQNVKGHVEFKNVKFSYEGTDKMVINNFSAIAKPGQKIAIVGPTGVVNLLQVKYYKKIMEKSRVSGSKMILSITFRQNCCRSSWLRAS